MTSDPDRELDAALREALSVEPSPGFLPRLRERLRHETPSRVPAWWPGALLAGAAAGVIALFTLLPDTTATLSPPPRAARATAPPPMARPPSPVAPTEAPRTQARPARGAARPPSTPAPVVPAGQDAAIARFVSGEAGLDPAVGLGRALAGWSEPETLSELRIEPLSIEPLSRSGT
jgi:hypothetical protein